MFEVKEEIIDWLLETENQPVRFLTLTKLLEKNENDSKVVNIKEDIMNYRPIKTILEKQIDNTYWFDKGKTKNYKKYLGTFWQLIFLAEMKAQKNEQISNAIEYIFSTGQAANGGFSVTGTNTYTIHCLTSNILKMLIHFGYLEDDRTQKALEYLLSNFVDTNGKIRCQTIGLVSNCYMTLPKIVHALGAIPAELRDKRINLGIDIAVQRLLKNRIFNYVPVLNKDWLKIVSQRKLKGLQLAEERKKYFIDHPNMKYQPKASWLKFGFPLSYTSDALDAMRAFVYADIPFHENMQDSLNLIKEKAQTGKWIKERKFNSPMYSEIEPYQEESKWITFQALEVLKHYEGIKIVE